MRHWWSCRTRSLIQLQTLRDTTACAQCILKFCAAADSIARKCLSLQCQRLKNKADLRPVWWCSPAFLAPRRPRQKCHNFKANLDYTAGPCLRTPKNKNKTSGLVLKKTSKLEIIVPLRSRIHTFVQDAAMVGSSTVKKAHACASRVHTHVHIRTQG